MQNSTWSLLGQAASSAASSYQTYQSGIASAGAYGVQAQQSQRAAEWAIDQAKLNNTKLIRLYNETTANQAVQFAVQGRSFSGGSIQNILSTDEENLQWDLDFNMREAEKQAKAFREDAQGYLRAGDSAKSTAKTSSTIGLLGTTASIVGAIANW